MFPQRQEAFRNGKHLVEMVGVVYSGQKSHHLLVYNEESYDSEVAGQVECPARLNGNLHLRSCDPWEGRALRRDSQEGPPLSTLPG